MKLEKAAILGATGPIGTHLARELARRDVPFRVVSRSMDHLERTFPGASVDRVAADLTDTAETRRAIEGCNAAFHCIGLPPDQMRLHPVAARSVADAVTALGVRCVHASSYWAFLPAVGSPLNEDHPRQGGGEWIRLRREAEDILREAGAAIANLPDFYGPDVHTSTLQNALVEAARGKTMHWLGPRGAERAYAFVPDAAATLVNLADEDAAYGEHWLIPTAGTLNGQRLTEIVSAAQARPVKLRSVGLMTLRILSLVDSGMRGFLQMAPHYVGSMVYETTKIERLLGPQHVTAYEDGIRQTLDWLRTRDAASA
jgi:nucleoside-diphosphate-sugar epimerase